MDYQMLPPVDLYLMCEPDAAVPLLIDAVQSLIPNPSPGGRRGRSPPPRGEEIYEPLPLRERGRGEGKPASVKDDSTLTLAGVAHALEAATRGVDRCISRLPLGWHG